MTNEQITATRKFIQTQYPGFPVPKKSYLVLMIPRTGSNLLTTHLQRIDFGYPIEAFHFNHTNIRKQYDWDIDFNDPVALMRKAIEFQMVEGIFGMKLNWLQFQTFLKTAHQITDPYNPDLTDKELIEVFFPNTSFIYMKRFDKVKQAVSLSRGKQTGIWTVKIDQSDNYKNYILPAVYNRAHIEGCLEDLLSTDSAWENYLHIHDIEYLEVWYNNLANDFIQEMSRIYAHLGINREKVIAPVLRKQGNASSQEWADRFRSETPWLNNPRIAESLENGDFKTAFIERSMMLIRKKEERSWRAMPSNHFISLRKFLLRARNKALRMIGVKK